LEKLVAPKPILLIIPEIGVSIEATLINIVTHTFEVFKTQDIILKDTLVEKLRSQLIILVKPVDTTSE
jgi:hypothetical protein